MVPYLQRDVYEARVTPTNVFLSPLIFALLLPQPAPPTTPTFPITPGGAPIVVCVCGVHDTAQHSQPPFPAPHMGDAFGVGPPYTALKEHAWYGFAAYPRPRSDATDSGSNSASPSECRDASASADGGSDYTYSAARLELGLDLMRAPAAACDADLCMPTWGYPTCVVTPCCLMLLHPGAPTDECTASPTAACRLTLPCHVVPADSCHDALSLPVCPVKNPLPAPRCMPRCRLSLERYPPLPSTRAAAAT
ncbi:hypothetical protein GGX14DRAFT_655002 [Mycena pura]|uniref:Uncharacterized protein n=1 Tax=Mycena pura TaxID=153505 RepID=A0AAD6V441_9AGAR|nr:hypothetical protein GGX14DRAFT_655002 [Mycena pura]